MARQDEARALAAGALCLRGEGSPCLACPPCRKVLEGGHPDVYWLRPEADRVWIGVDQTRKLRVALLRAPHEGRCKIAMIEADALNANAQSALLSVLEEPPGDTRFILLSENPLMLLPTIRSRCVARRLRNAPEEAKPGKEAHALMNALLSGDEWMWAAACFSMEKKGRDDLPLVLDELAALLAGGLSGRDVLTARRFGGIIDRVRTLQDMLAANAGVKHVCGALAVCGFAEIS